MSDPVPSPTKGERTRQALLGAAIARFGRDGYRRTSVADVARDVGLSTTAAYAYFPNKGSLFVAAVDEDAAMEIEEGMALLAERGVMDDMRSILPVFMERLDHHPLARRVLAGLEPEFTVRLIGIPALEQLRKGMAEHLTAQQLSGEVRPDVDPRRMANGIVGLLLSLLMSLVQTGTEPIDVLADDVIAVFQAALRPPSG